MGEPDGTGRVLNKDVYDLVDSTRKEVTASITDLGAKFDAFVTSNEHRLTIVETHQAAQAQQISEVFGRLDGHGRDIGAIKDQLQKDEAANDALTGAKKSRWNSRQNIVTVACTIALAVSAILAFVLH